MTEQNTLAQQEHMKKLMEAAQAEARKKQLELEQAAEELKKQKEELETLRAAQAEAEKAREDENKKLAEQIERIKQEKREEYKKIVDKETNPYFDMLREGDKNDPRLQSSVDHLKETINNGLNDAFMKPEDEKLFRVVTACASRDRYMAGELDTFIKKTTDLESAIRERDEQIKKKEEEKAEAEKLKDEMIKKLKEELEGVKAKFEVAQGDVNNPASHFQQGTEQQSSSSSSSMEMTDALEQPGMRTVTANAAANSANRGYAALYSTHFGANYDWRTMCSKGSQDILTRSNEDGYNFYNRGYGQ